MIGHDDVSVSNKFAADFACSLPLRFRDLAELIAMHLAACDATEQVDAILYTTRDEIRPS